MKSVDVLIIGGSLAGAACVRELAKQGVDAVAFERERFPRDKVCGGFLSPGAVETLDRLGVLNAVRECGAVEVKSARVRTPHTDVNLNFRRPGLGISRRTLDTAVANHPDVQQGSVLEICRGADGFLVRVDDRELRARVVIDAAGKLSRFTRHRATQQFGIQYYEPHARGNILDFWFFADGYGGAVSVEGDRSNACFLVSKKALPRYAGRQDCRITGPVAYRVHDASFIAVGDAAGMIDPFCGEGMHHALDTGILAARAVAGGLRRGGSYEEMCREYRRERFRRWAAKRAFARMMSAVLQRRGLVNLGMRIKPEWLIQRFWGT